MARPIRKRSSTEAIVSARPRAHQRRDHFVYLIKTEMVNQGRAAKSLNWHGICMERALFQLAATYMYKHQMV